MLACLPLGVLLALVTPLILALLYLNLATFSFARRGLSSEAALMVLFASLVGGMINIPLSSKRVVVQQLPRGIMRFSITTCLQWCDSEFSPSTSEGPSSYWHSPPILLRVRPCFRPSLPSLSWRRCVKRSPAS